MKKTENFNNLIQLLCDIDANIKRISRQSQLNIKLNASNVLTIKLLFKLYNLASTKPSIAIRVAVVFLVLSIAIEIHLGLINISNVTKQGSILKKEKNRYNSLGFCYYCDKARHIAIDYKNSTLLAIKKQVIGIFTDNSMALVPYKSFSIKEKKMSLS